MMELFFFIFATIGLTHVVVDGSIFNPFKEWLAKPSKYRLFTSSKNFLLTLMNCYICSGTHSGWIIGLLMWCCEFDPLHSPWDWTHALMLIVYAFAGSFLSMLGAVVLMFMQAHSGVE